MVFVKDDEWPNTYYNSKINNVVTEFFIPALKNATTYRRVCGLFSSNSFALCARGIKELIANEGKMELVISPILSKEDSKVLQEIKNVDYEKIISESIIKELNSIESEFEKDHVDALRTLLKEEFLEIRINIPKDQNGNYLSAEEIINQNMYSEKIGIFQDAEGNIVSFRGIVNENRNSWEKGNFSLTVDVSWIEGQKKHVFDDINNFKELWNSDETHKLMDLVKKEIIKDAPEISNIDLEKYNVPPWARLPNGGILWDNQIRAVNAWIENCYKGIFTIATAGGKTLAALAASSIVPKNVLILIIVHGLELVNQWEKEIQFFDPKGNITICDSEHKWRENLGLIISPFFKNKEKVDFENRFYVLVNDSTASDDKEEPKGFLRFFDHVDPTNIMIISDEVHHIGSTQNQKILQIESKYRLALSATFVRQWDEEGTQIIRDYFGDELLDAKYSVADGIRDGRLCKYLYYPFFAILEQSEFEQYNEKTIDIGIITNQLKKDPNNEKLKQKLSTIANIRADIIKKAKNKKKAYEEIIKAKPKLPYVVFLDDTNQVNEFRNIHNQIIDKINESEEEKIKKNVFVFDGTTKPWQRKTILKQTVEHKTPIFSMYCLDEGIDVPEFQSAILVSSASSERQYIQRRGRILRGAIHGKIAELYDIVVLPQVQESGIKIDTANSIIEKELKRVEEMAKDALNKPEAKNLVNGELKKLGFEYIF